MLGFCSLINFLPPYLNRRPKGAVFFNPGYPVGVNFKGYEIFVSKNKGSEIFQKENKGYETFN